MKFVKVRKSRDERGNGIYWIIEETSSEYRLVNEPSDNPKTSFPIFKVHCFEDKDTIRKTIAYRRERASKIGVK